MDFQGKMAQPIFSFKIVKFQNDQQYQEYMGIPLQPQLVQPTQNFINVEDLQKKIDLISNNGKVVQIQQQEIKQEKVVQIEQQKEVQKEIKEIKQNPIQQALLWQASSFEQAQAIIKQVEKQEKNNIQQKQQEKEIIKQEIVVEKDDSLNEIKESSSILMKKTLKPLQVIQQQQIVIQKSQQFDQKSQLEISQQQNVVQNKSIVFKQDQENPQLILQLQKTLNGIDKNQNDQKISFIKQILDIIDQNLKLNGEELKQSSIGFMVNEIKILKHEIQQKLKKSQILEQKQQVNLFEDSIKYSQQKRLFTQKEKIAQNENKNQKNQSRRSSNTYLDFYSWITKKLENITINIEGQNGKSSNNILLKTINTQIREIIDLFEQHQIENTQQRNQTPWSTLSKTQSLQKDILKDSALLLYYEKISSLEKQLDVLIQSQNQKIIYNNQFQVFLKNVEFDRLNLINNQLKEALGKTIGLNQKIDKEKNHYLSQYNELQNITQIQQDKLKELEIQSEKTLSKYNAIKGYLKSLGKL